jgi:hypothetical protein
LKSKRLILRILLAGAALGVAGLLVWGVFFRPPSAREITAVLNTTIIPRLLLKDTPYLEAGNVVLEHLRQRHPEFSRVRVADYFPEGEPRPSENNPFSTGRVSLERKDIQAYEALHAIATRSNLLCVVYDGTIYFCAPGAPGSNNTLPPPTMGERLSMQVNRVYWRVRDAFTR